MVGVEVAACDGVFVASSKGEDILEWKIGTILTARYWRDINVV